MSNLRMKRLANELKNYSDDDSGGQVTAGPKDEDKLELWVATMIGPKGTPYEDGIFELEIHFPEQYPSKPPVLKMLTKIFHPNIKDTMICLDILKDNWSPALTISKVLLSLCSLLADPNPDDPLDADAAHLYKSNKLEFERRARTLTRKFAMGNAKK